MQGEKEKETERESGRTVSTRGSPRPAINIS